MAGTPTWTSDRVRPRPRRVGAPDRRRPATRRDRRRRRAARHRRAPRRRHPVRRSCGSPHPCHRPGRRTTPKAPRRSRCATAIRPRSPTTSTTAASTSATSPPRRRRLHRLVRRPGRRPGRASCSPPPATSSPNSTPAPAPTASPHVGHAGARDPGRAGQLADGLPGSAGDTIITRQNDRQHPDQRAPTGSRTATGGPSSASCESGALQRHPPRTAAASPCPPSYVAEHVELGYASTVHAAQGITADTCHTVATGEESRQLLYVAMTRGRNANHVYLATAGDGDPHAVITRDALLPPTAVDILTRVLARDGAPVSATSPPATSPTPPTALRDAADRYYDALNTAAASHARTRPAWPHRRRRRGRAAAPHRARGLPHAARTPRPVRRRRARPGRDARRAAPTPTAVWPTPATSPRCSTGDSASRRPTGNRPRVVRCPGCRRSHTLASLRQPGAASSAAAEEVRRLAEAVAAQATQWTPTDAPAWARPLLDLTAGNGPPPTWP